MITLDERTHEQQLNPDEQHLPSSRVPTPIRRTQGVTVSDRKIETHWVAVSQRADAAGPAPLQIALLSARAFLRDVLDES